MERRRFTREFKLEAVRLIRDRGFRIKKAAGRRLVILIIAAAPGVEVEHAVRAEYHLASMAEIVGKNRGAKAGRQRDAAVIAGAGASVRTALLTLRSRLGQHHRPGRKQRGRGKKNSSQNFRSTSASRRMKARGIDHDDAPCCKPVL